MKVSNTEPYKLVFSVKTHPQLGVIIEPFVVAYTASFKLSLTHQKVFSGNATYYPDIDDEKLRWIKILDALMPENIVKVFSPEKKIRPKEYFAKHWKKEIFSAVIRPFIEDRLQKLLKEMITANFDALYIADDINPAAKKIKIQIETSKVLFHFRRTENGTNYFVTLKSEDQRLMLNKESIILTQQPCFLITENHLLHFHSFVDATKFLPFLKKKYISISPSQEDVYFKKFVVKLLENYPVYAEGFEIKTEKLEAKMLLHLQKHGQNKVHFAVKVVYGEFTFDYHSEKQVHVSYKRDKSDQPEFTKVLRSKAWEERKVHFLQNLGLDNKLGNNFVVQGATLQETLTWYRNSTEALQSEGIEVVMPKEFEYSTDIAQLTYKITEKYDWFDVEIWVKIGEFQIPFKSFVKNLKSGDREYALPDGKIFYIPDEWFAKNEYLSKSTLTGNVYSIKKYQLDVLDAITAGTLKKQVAQLQHIESVTPHILFNGTLRGYQQKGLNWLMFLYKNKFGGILADDMGLGKTVQTLAYLQKVIHQNEGQGKEMPLDLFTTTIVQTKTNFLVAPTSLLHNWKSEAQKFTPELKVCVHTGAQRTKSLIQLQSFDLIITSYGLIRNDFELLAKLDIDCLILDESQNIKNPGAKTTQLIKKLRAEHRVALTGTPIENTIKDLWSQMQFLNKGLLGTEKQFENYYIKPIEKELNKDRENELRQLIKPFLLRRTKKEVASDLPLLTEKIVKCDMEADQSAYYEEIKSLYRNELLNIVKEKGIEKSKLNVLQGLTKLRQIANHPQLIDAENKRSSGKHNALLMHIDTALAEGHKVLVFSQFVKYLNLLSADLLKKNIPHFQLKGATPAEERAAMVEKFQTNDDIKLFLISLKAGGTGLTLTAADYVFIVDPWWNPAAEAQARDRAHRIGQDKRVFSYRFISVDTVEEKITQLQQQKRRLANDLIKTENNVLQNIDINDIKLLFG